MSCNCKDTIECNKDVHENNITIEKSVDKENTIVGDTVKYSITVTNKENTLINNITIIDTVDSALTFVIGSVVVDGVKEESENVLEGVDIGPLKPGEVKTLTFEANVLNMPQCGYIENSAIAKFYYDPHLNGNLEIMDKTSNIVCIKIDIADIKIVKTADKEKASIGDTVNYKVTLTNVGTLEAKNILFLDNIPLEVNLVSDSLSVNGKVINYSDNDIDVYVGSVLPGESINITYKVILKSSNCSGLLINTASVKFNYSLCNWKFGEKVATSSEMATCEVKVGINTFKQISIDENLCIPEVKPDIEEINDIKVEAEILGCHVISTPNITSNEGQILCGYKLIVRGVLKEFLEYTSETKEQSVHSAHYSIPFSSFIILPPNYTLGSKIDVEAKVEDVYYKLIDNRCFFKNVTLLIKAKIMSC